MKRHFSFFLTIIFVFCASSVVVASAEDDGCKLQGSFISYDTHGVPTWISSAYGQSTSSGANELEYPGEFPKLPTPDGAIFPSAVGMTHLTGAWQRTGGNTFKYTFIGYGYDENGVPLWIGRMSGPIKLSKDCNTGEFGATLYVYPCSKVGNDWTCPNPYGDDNVTVIPVETSYGYRVTVD